MTPLECYFVGARSLIQSSNRGANGAVSRPGGWCDLHHGQDKLAPVKVEDGLSTLQPGSKGGVTKGQSTLVIWV